MTVLQEQKQAEGLTGYCIFTAQKNRRTQRELQW
jgi:hypothetical protein